MYFTCFLVSSISLGVVGCMLLKFCYYILPFQLSLYLIHEAKRAIKWRIHLCATLLQNLGLESAGVKMAKDGSIEVVYAYH